MSKDNKRCNCGSGKKYKNCCKNKKDRILEIDIHPSNVKNLDGIAFSNKGELLRVTSGMIMPFLGPTTLSYGYERGNGKKKILTEGLITDGKCYLNPNHPLLNYEHLFAVDTNTDVIDDIKVSIAGVAYSSQLEKDADKVALSVPKSVSCYEYRNIEGNEERLVWKEMIEGIERAEQYSNGKIGLIVDSDLENHSKYNKRELPIYDDFLLPERFTILYGSADSGMENMANRMIRFCDKRAAYIMDALKDGFTVEEDGKVDDKPYSHFRQWFPDHDHPSNQLHLTEKERDNIKEYKINNT